MQSILYFALIYNWMTGQISDFQTHLMSRATSLVVAVALVLVTLWVLMTGYKILTGQLRQELMGLVADMAKIVLIVSIAGGWSGGASYIENLLSTDLPNGIMALMSGSDDSIAKTIDSNLTYTQLAMTAVDAVQVSPGDTEGAAAKAQTAMLANFGTASPPMVAGALYLMYKWFMAFFIGLGPIFIMCLIFQKTRHLFDKWLFFGISTMFSMAALAVMTTVALKLTALSAAAFFTGDILARIVPGSAEGLTTQAMEQGGVGLLMTLILLTVPRSIGNYFGGALGEFMPYSVLGGGGRPGPQGQPPGAHSGGTAGYAPSQAIAQQTNPARAAGGDSFGIGTRGTSKGTAPTDTVRPYQPPPTTSN